jgi:hypothetical protein
MEKMDKSLESVKRSFATVRTGRANPAMLDRIEVGPEVFLGLYFVTGGTVGRGVMVGA